MKLLKFMKLFKLLKRKGSKLNIKSIDKQIGKYSEWKRVEVKISDGELFFHVQPYMSSFEIDKIIENYGKFLEKYAEEIDEASSGDTSKALKIIYGILYSFLVRYKSDILSVEDKHIIEDYSGEQMLLFSLKFISLNMFDQIIEFYDESSMDILFNKFNNILKTANKLTGLRSFVREIDKNKNNKETVLKA